MTRATVAIALVLSACGASHEPGLEYEVPKYWEASADDWAALWEILDERYGVGDHDCFHAYDNVAFVEGPRSMLEELGCGRYACVISGFPHNGSVPLGVYTIAFWDEISAPSRCNALAEELVHVADNCLAQNLKAAWPFAGIDHAPELYDGLGDEYPVELELKEQTYQGCLKGM